MEKFNFKKGDNVPQFVEKYSEKDMEGKFLVDVLVIKYDDYTEVYPTEDLENGYGVMKFDKKEGYEGYMSVNGLPTRIFNHPYGSDLNYKFVGISY